MKIDYAVLWPGGNTTALVTTALDRSVYVEIANAIMRNNTDIEQVGFLESGKNNLGVHLQMMGGEFCGNATRSAAYWYFLQTQQTKFLMSTSGLDKVVACEIIGDQVHVTLPMSLFIDFNKKKDYTVVALQGIKHCIVQNLAMKTEDIIKVESVDSEAVGVIYLKNEKDQSIIDPWVWVKEIDKTIHESACGSGSIAVALLEQYESDQKDKIYSIAQPSGENLYIAIDQHNDQIHFSGTVKLLQNQSIDFISNDTASLQ